MSSRYAAMALIAACSTALSAGIAPGVLKAVPGPVVEGQAGAAIGHSADSSRCSVTAKTELVSALVAAFNAGHDRAVDRLVAPEPAFMWFSAPGRTAKASRLNDEAEDRSTLRAYIRQRHRHRERWTRVEFGGSLHLPLTLTREADDYPRRRGPGKVDAICAGGKAQIIVWSL